MEVRGRPPGGELGGRSILGTARSGTPLQKLLKNLKGSKYPRQSISVLFGRRSVLFSEGTRKQVFRYRDVESP